ncbi:transaldolase [Globicatella sulfidifaciens]|uniref:Transaldolase n=1 Tax=Globicatella sulfidifaciens TaxID=136093 RepID=A0A7X8C202_9LACT|nr:transaldolase [Globicatella sulfidifaciens]NLJ17552.1 transaldolase [Globicatella sulfidifaciens]
MQSRGGNKLDLKVKLYADGANINDMKAQYKNGVVSGFTTNPSLMKKAGVKDYVSFAEEVVNEIPDMSISFEVFADDFDQMKLEARKIAEFGENVYVKIPITNTRGESSIPLIKKLSSEGINLNITAVFTIDQVKEILSVISPKSKTIISVFAGRIADTGINPVPTMEDAVSLCKSHENVELLWASTREVFNIVQANEVGVDIITCPTDILNKLHMLGMDLEELSVETVKGFYKDVESLGYSIL